MSVVYGDYRLFWLKCTISNLLGVYDGEFVSNAVDEHEEQFKDFLSEKFTRNADIDRIVIFFWRTFYDKLVEEEVTVLEEVEAPPPPEPLKDAKRGKKGKVDKAGKGKKLSTEPSKSSLAEDPPKRTSSIRSAMNLEAATEDTDTGIETEAVDEEGTESYSARSKKSKGKKRN